MVKGKFQQLLLSLKHNRSANAVLVSFFFFRIPNSQLVNLITIQISTSGKFSESFDISHTAFDYRNV